MAAPVETVFSPTTIFGWFGLIGLVIVGLVALFGQFSKVMRDRRSETDTEETKTINLLKTQVELLEKKVEEATQALLITNQRLDGLQSENKLLREVLQGRDAQTQHFQEEGFKAMQQSASTIGSITGIEERVNKILDIIEHREVVVTKIHKDIQDTLDRANKKR